MYYFFIVDNTLVKEEKELLEIEKSLPAETGELFLLCNFCIEMSVWFNLLLLISFLNF